jgi:NDP-sugar pyrophosphorylase family protein
MQIVIPMSGLGNRFKAAGYKDPKPLILVDGKPIIEHVVSMFPGEQDFLFICSNEHLKTTNMQETLSRIAPKGQIVGIDPHKLGPVYAVMCTADSIKDQEPVIVSYCDYYTAWDYEKFKAAMSAGDFGGCVPCYRGFHPHLLLPNLYAGVRADSKGNLAEIREKFSFTPNKMDTWQSSGTYYFKSGAVVKKYFQRLIDRKLTCKDEYYVSLVYNLLVEDRLEVGIFEQPYFCQWGTPEDLEIYQAWSHYFSGLIATKTSVAKEEI